MKTRKDLAAEGLTKFTYAAGAQDRDCHVIVPHAAYFELMGKVNDLLKEHTFRGLRWSESNKTYVETKFRFSIGEDVVPEPGLEKNGIPIKYKDNVVCGVKDNAFESLIPKRSKPLPKLPSKKEKEEAEIQIWKTPGNRTITYNSKNKTVQIDDELPFPIISIDRRFAPEKIYIQVTQDMGIYAGATSNPNTTLYGFKFPTNDKPVKSFYSDDFVLSFEGEAPIITGIDNIYLLEKGKYMNKTDETFKPLQTKKL